MSSPMPAPALAAATAPAPALVVATGLPPVPLAYRWVRPMAVVAIGFVVATAFDTKPRPGLRGDHLAVSLALLCVAVGIAAMLRASAPRVLVPVLTMIAVGSAMLVALQPEGPGFFGVFPAAAAAALRLPARLSATVAALASGALLIGWLIGSRPLTAVVLNEFGVVAFYLVALMARRLREANAQAQVLITELEETRAAQAQAAALGERQRLAREMHDVLAHSLSGLVLNLDAARLIARRDGTDAPVAEAIERAHRLAKSGLEEARRAIGMLRDDELPGPSRLAELAATFQLDSGIECGFGCTGAERELGADGRLTLYRVAQEALTNIRKHARATRVDIRVDYEPGGTRLTVENVERGVDGSGTHPGVAVAGTGYGLTGMRERAELLGGALTAGPTDSGFRVELWVPA